MQHNAVDVKYNAGKDVRSLFFIQRVLYCLKFYLHTLQHPCVLSFHPCLVYIHGQSAFARRDQTNQNSDLIPNETV